MLSQILTKMISSAAPRPPYAPDFDPTPVTPVATDPRKRLREAQRDLALAEAALDRSRDATARARAAVREAAEAASTDWAAAGAQGEPPASVQTLIQKADAARTRAYAKKLIANGAELALSQSAFDSSTRGTILETEREALVARDNAKYAVARAVRSVLEAEVAAPALDRAEELRAALDAELTRLLPLWQTLRMSSNVLPFAGSPKELQDELERLATHGETARQLPRDNTITRCPEQRDAEKALAAYGQRLMTDAEATL